MATKIYASMLPHLPCDDLSIVVYDLSAKQSLGWCVEACSGW
jgi:hypothetical protein